MGRAESLRVWVLGTALVGGCGDASSEAKPAPAPKPPGDSAEAGKVQPAPSSELALGREVFAVLQRDDWEDYTNLLVTRADMMPFFAEIDRRDARERRRRRRMVWRRVNRLRDGEAEQGWKDLRSAASEAGVDWQAARLVDVRRQPADDVRLPPQLNAVLLRLVIEHGDATVGVDLGPCIEASRGWVTLYPLQWRGAEVFEPFGESLLSAPAG